MRPLARAVRAFAAAAALGLTVPAHALIASDFGTTPDGQQVRQYRLRNARGSEVDVISYGARLRAWRTRTSDGRTIDIVLGYDTLQEYLDNRGYYGATVGRFANRIANAELPLEGRTYPLTANNGRHSLHGGPRGFSFAVWTADDAGRSRGDDSVTLRYLSADGEEGFPGALTAWVTYTLTDRDELRIDYRATTTAPTVVNLTNHSYFNLRGAGEGDVLGQHLQIEADRYTPTDATNIPTGAIDPVEGTRFDFRYGATLGERVTPGHGYDTNFVVRGRAGQLRLAATLREPHTGLEMRVSTTEPGVQFFTANFPTARPGKDGRNYQGVGAVCLETQHFPDSPHFAQFPSTELRPGQIFHSTTSYRLVRR